jgi:hypothetical protein
MASVVAVDVLTDAPEAKTMSWGDEDAAASPARLVRAVHSEHLRRLGVDARQLRPGRAIAIPAQVDVPSCGADGLAAS